MARTLLYPTLEAIWKSLVAVGHDFKGMKGTIMGALEDARAIGRAEGAARAGEVMRAINRLLAAQQALDCREDLQGELQMEQRAALTGMSDALAELLETNLSVSLYEDGREPERETSRSVSSDVHGGGPSDGR